MQLLVVSAANVTTECGAPRWTYPSIPPLLQARAQANNFWHANEGSEVELAIDRKLSVSGFAKKMIRRASESRSARKHADNDEGVDDAPSSTTPETVKSTGSQINT